MILTFYPLPISHSVVMYFCLQPCCRARTSRWTFIQLSSANPPQTEERRSTATCAISTSTDNNCSTTCPPTHSSPCRHQSSPLLPTSGGFSTDTRGSCTTWNCCRSRTCNATHASSLRLSSGRAVRTDLSGSRATNTIICTLLWRYFLSLDHFTELYSRFV